MVIDEAKCMYIWTKDIIELLPLLKKKPVTPTPPSPTPKPLPKPSVLNLENLHLKEIHIP